MKYEIETINDLCKKITDGSHFSPEHEDSGEYQMYSVKDMEYNGFINSNCKMIGKEMFMKLLKSDCRPLKNDILIAKDGSYLKYAFKVKEDLNACILSSIAILRPNEKMINPDYFVYLMRSQSIKSAMANYVSGSALPRIILSDFKKMKLKIISDINVQQKIANILSRYDEAIENNNKRIKLLEQMAQNLYKEWFVRFRFPGYENCEFENGIPVGWKVCRLKDFGKIITGKTPPTEQEEYYGEDVMFVKTPDMHGNIFVQSTSEYLSKLGCEYQKSQYIPENSIMVSCIGTGGITSINAYPANTNQQINSIILDDKNNLPWLYFTVSSMKETIKMFGNTGTTMTNLSKGKFEKLKVLKPYDELIQKFSIKVNPIFERIKLLNKQITNLAQQRDLLLPRLMSGKIEVR